MIPISKFRLSFCWLFFNSICLAQTPGNQPNLSLWLKADQGVTGNAPVTAWSDQSSLNQHPIINGDPTLQQGNFNYNPTVDLDGTGDFFEWPNLITDANEGEIFTVHSIPSSAPAVVRELWDWDNMSTAGSSYPYTNGIFYDDFGRTGMSSTTIGNLFLSYTDVTKQYIYNNSGDATGISNYIQGNLNVTSGVGFSAHDVNVTIGKGDFSTISTQPLISEMGEIVYFNQKLSITDRRKVWTYLAVKYGITLQNIGGGTNGDYLATNGNLVWDASDNPSYHNEVVGIARDDNEDLMQKQSHSIPDSYRVYLSTLVPLNLNNLGTFTNDISYATIGNNQGQLNSTLTSLLESPVIPNYIINKRLEREWKITKTNFVDSLSIDVITNPSFGDSSSCLVLLIDDDGDFSNGGTNYYYNNDGSGIIISAAGTDITLSNISDLHLPNNSTHYFTIAEYLPDVIANNDTTICPGQNLTLSANGALTYVWDNSLGAGQSHTVFPPANTSYVVFGADFKGCVNSDTVNVSLGSVPNSIDIVIACDSYTWIDGNAYTSNNTVATYTFVGGASSGCDSIVTLDLTINSSQSGIDVQSSCGSYTWIDGNTYTSNNTTATYTIVGGASSGCDSMVTLDLTINSLQSGIDVQSSCGSYTWIDGNTYTSNNTTATYTIVGGASSGCDSIITLDLTINSPQSGIDVQSSCSSYTWIDGNTYTSNNTIATYTFVGGASSGCDSIVTLDLTINSPQSGIDVQSSCGSYTWIDGNTYTSNNTTATHTLAGGASSGCDSLVTLNLTVLQNFTISLGEDTTICEDPILLTLNDNYFSFLWSDGSTNEDLEIYNPGIYSVTVSDFNGCFSTDTIEINFCPASVYVPNTFSPNGDGINDLFFVESEGLEELEMLIFNRWGHLIFSWDTLNGYWDGRTNSGLTVPTGVYVYVLKYKNFNGYKIVSNEKVGHVTIFR